MKAVLDWKIGNAYKSNSQRIRVMSEDWVGNEIFCPSCGSGIVSFEKNRPVADFHCSDCKEEYELKSKKGVSERKITDGAYGVMMERLRGANSPNLFCLNYLVPSYEVVNFMVIPKHFFVPEIIERRNPLSQTARRAGWVGCNILLANIPESGKIFYIKNGKVRKKRKILDAWGKTLFLRKEEKAERKGWILDVMRCIDKIGKNEFSLDEVYFFEEVLGQKYPGNRHVKDKIRQQLQLLRDKGYLEFSSRGRYKLI